MLTRSAWLEVPFRVVPFLLSVYLFYPLLRQLY